MANLNDIPDYKVTHFIGIGGTGMSPIAKLLLQKGYRVTGSDLKETGNTIRLRDLGAKVYIDHSSSNLREADLVVVSSAIAEDNDEYMFAKQERLPIYRRAEILNFLMSLYPKRVGVLGTHGKTTTTAMLARMFEALKDDPSYVIGGEFTDYGGNSSLGNGDYFISETDESDGSFEYVFPSTAIFTNLEEEHMDYYGSLDNLLSKFQVFMDRIIESGGDMIVNADDANLMQLINSYQKKSLKTNSILTFGIDSQADVQAKDIKYSPTEVSFRLFYNNDFQDDIILNVFGKHNVYNALAVIAFGFSQGFNVPNMKQGLYLFKGTKRRLQLVGDRQGIQIYDDYGHHPTEIRTTLEGLKSSLTKRVICIFQPHRYSRTKALLEGFKTAFDAADIVIITDVFSANEKKIEGVSGETLVEQIDKDGLQVMYVSNKSEVSTVLLPYLKRDDVVVTMGAGDIYSVSKELYARLNSVSVS